MKKTNITLALLLLIVSPIFSQNFAGKRIYSGTLSLNLNSYSYERPQNGVVSSAYNSDNFNVNTTFLTGKIKANNTYTAYGFNLGIKSTNLTYSNSSFTPNPNITKDNLITIGPAVQFGKFVKIFDSFYYAPALTCSVTGSFGNGRVLDASNSGTFQEAPISGFGASANISPIRFIYQVKETILLSMGLGYADLSYNYLHSKSNNSPSFTTNTHNLTLYGNVSNFTGIGAFYLF
jgi:hypothetical protein